MFNRQLRREGRARSPLKEFPVLRLPILEYLREILSVIIFFISELEWIKKKKKCPFYPSGLLIRIRYPNTGTENQVSTYENTYNCSVFCVLIIFSNHQSSAEPGGYVVPAGYVVKIKLILFRFLTWVRNLYGLIYPGVFAFSPLPPSPRSSLGNNHRRRQGRTPGFWYRRRSRK